MTLKPLGKDTACKLLEFPFCSQEVNMDPCATKIAKINSELRFEFFMCSNYWFIFIGLNMSSLRKVAKEAKHTFHSRLKYEFAKSKIWI